MMVVAHALQLGSLGLAGCASARGEAPEPAAPSPIGGHEQPVLLPLDLADPRGDVRLAHPRHEVLETRHFDLERVTLGLEDGLWRLEATFAEPVPTLTEVRAARDRVVAMLPQTLDVYLDLAADHGHLAALPGRGFKVPAAEAWDRVLVASSVPDLAEPGVVHALRLSAQGRRLVATFPRDAIPDAASVRGVLVVVLATSAAGEGRVRGVSRRGGDCQVWNEERCLLEGDGPAVLDALAVEVLGERPIALLYAEGARPVALGTPVIFTRGALVGAAPVSSDEIAKGDLATIYDATGAAIGTAIVLSVVGDTASLEVVGQGELANASRVVFSKGATR